jgi:hypothetical protein
MKERKSKWGVGGGERIGKRKRITNFGAVPHGRSISGLVKYH